ncbi:MAG: response regulator [Cytophagaceae bacterium]|nr:response regulator [Gemmatimonadaceae bacterium]
MTVVTLPAYDALFEHAACGLLVTSPDGTIQRVNTTFCEWLGYAADELISTRRVQDLITVGGRIFHQTHWVPMLQMQGSISEVKLDALHRDGRSIPMLFNAVRRRHGDETLDELAVLIVSDRQKYERALLVARRGAEEAQVRLREADRRKDEFLATLAHELRNPLAPIRNVVEILKMQRLVDPSLVWARDVLERQVMQMTHLVDDLLEVSRITQGKVDLRLQRVVLAEALRVAVEAARPLVVAARHTLEVILPDETIVLHADPTRLTQMILNILNNAVRYTPDGGHISVAGAVVGADVVVTVRDSGIGMTPEQVTRIFEMFTQVSSTSRRSEGGLGIGLALVKAFAELHGGRVAARSEGLGRGSELTLVLPIGVPNDRVPDVEPAARAPVTRRRIAVVDDTVDAADSMVLVLEALGHEVRVAHDGLAAVALAAEFRPDVVLLDIGLPGIDGHEVARRIREAPWGREQLLVALTGWGSQEDHDATARAGFDVHLVKPVGVDHLQSVLATLDANRAR